jgi:hypothetical protein
VTERWRPRRSVIGIARNWRLDFPNLESGPADVWLVSATSERHVVAASASVRDDGTDDEVMAGP